MVCVPAVSLGVDAMRPLGLVGSGTFEALRGAAEIELGFAGHGDEAVGGSRTVREGQGG